MELKLYEIVFAIKSSVGDDQVDSIISRIEKKIKSASGQIEKVDRWGTRKLPFVFQKHKNVKNAVYVVIYFKAPSNVPALVCEQLRVTEEVIRFTVDRSTGPKQAAPEKKAAPTEEDVVALPDSMLEPPAAPKEPVPADMSAKEQKVG